MKPIGDNLITVAKSKRYSDHDFRRLFLWAIDECNPPPPEGLEVVAEFIEADQSALLRRIAEREAERKEKRKEYAKRQYEKTKAKRANSDNSDSSDDSDNSDSSDSTIPTNLPTSQPANHVGGTPTPPTPAPSLSAVAAARASYPTIDDVLTVARNLSVPEDFARQFYAEMTRDNWAYVNRRGFTATVNKLCLASVLGGRWRARKRGGAADGTATKRGGSANQPEGVIHHEENYENPFEHD